MRFDAVAYLEHLFDASATPSETAESRLQRELAMLPDPPPGISPEDLSPDLLEAWRERVAIMVEDGKVPLEHAEAKALADVLGQKK